MRIAAISDIHGNIWALEAVLQDARARGVDAILNLGDILSGPLDPSATAELLMSLDLPTIRGNHERQLLACAEQPGRPSDQYAYKQTNGVQRAWLQNLPATLTCSGDIFMCHGTPSNDLVYFLEHVDTNGARLASGDAVERHAQGVEHSLILCGHSHKPRSYAISRDRLVVNPGSVGLQAYDSADQHFHVMENGSPHARYAICERSGNEWDVAHLCVNYDFRKAAASARRNGRDEWARWLETGRAR